MRTLWSKPEIKRLVLLHNKGMTRELIGEEMGRSAKAVESMLWRLQQGEVQGVALLPWYRNDNAKIGHLDIETSNLVGNAGFMLSWSIKVTGDKLYSDCIKGEEIRDATTFDKRLCESLVAVLKTLDVVTTYWGTGFDIPFIRTRCLGWGLDFPRYGSIAHLDMFYAVRSLLKLHRKSLDATCAFFGIEGKTHLNMEIWFKARVGHEESLAYVLEHNQGDVDILEKLWLKLEPYRKWTRKSI